MVSPEIREKLKSSFLSGNLMVNSVNPLTGEVHKSVVSDVMQHETSHKKSVKLTLEDGSSVISTEDHSLFFKQGQGIAVVRASDIKSGDMIACVSSDLSLVFRAVSEVLFCEPESVTYDLCVPGDENFVLSNGILAHNSYSIGGINLDIEKSSKYQSLRDGAQQQFDKATESKMITTKIMRGLQQSKFNQGLKSAFGPKVGKGILAPSSFFV